ncbi:MAG: tail fiber domain-containing protein [Desulfobacteraceae bacterium]|nr:tail fiber domain-containing protein [Desulfobacteraceae bacterium]
MRNLFSFILIGCVLLSTIGSKSAFAEDITITTYYPAPFGVYEELRAKKMGIGSTYMDPTTVNVADDNLIVEGNVGIGTINPQTRLHVENNVGVGVNWASFPWLGDMILASQDANLKLVGRDATSGLACVSMSEVNNAGNHTDEWTVGRFTSTSGSKFLITYEPAGGTHWWGHHGYKKLTILPNGNVGIGTDNPQETLHVVGDKLLLEDASAEIIFKDTDDADWMIRTRATDKFEISSGDYDTASWNTRVTIKDNGNVGIGTDDPQKPLHIAGDGEIMLEDQSTVIWFMDPGDDDFKIWNWEDNLYFCSDTGSGWNTIMTLKSDGKLGIGTTNPQAVLHVKGDLMRLTDSSAEFQFDQTNVSPNGDWSIVTWGNGLRIRAGDADTSSWGERITILNNGRVGIGDTTPGYKLDVNGNLRCFGFTNSSDVRWKKNITILGNPLDKLIQLRGVRYEWNQEGYPDKDFAQGPQIGIVAQELETQYPELIDTDEEGYKSIQYGKFTPVLLEAVKAQQTEIAELRTRIENLE